jgi:hypothetical protein
VISSERNRHTKQKKSELGGRFNGYIHPIMGTMAAASQAGVCRHAGASEESLGPRRDRIILAGSAVLQRITEGLQGAGKSRGRDAQY